MKNEDYVNLSKESKYVYDTLVVIKKELEITNSKIKKIISYINENPVVTKEFKELNLIEEFKGLKEVV